jgi:hypothetical protein
MAKCRPSVAHQHKIVKAARPLLTRCWNCVERHSFIVDAATGNSDKLTVSLRVAWEGTTHETYEAAAFTC